MEGKTKNYNTWVSKASAVMRALHYSVVMKQESSKKAKLSICKTVFVPFLTYGYESLVMTETARLQFSASFRNKVFTKIRRS